MIPLFRPCMGQAELEAVKDVLFSQWIGLGPKTAEFEQKFSEYIDVPYTVGLNSCTSALDMALKLLGIKNGDEVIIPTMTFVSTAHAVAYNLAYPIFADVNTESRNIDLEDVARKITCRTRAVIPVHYSGRPVDLDKLKEVVGDIPIIEDAAHACGSLYKGKHIGSHGNIACFSFHAVKNLAMGDGGALTTDNKEYYERAKRMRWLGIDRGTWDRTAVDKSYWWEYLVDEIGLKCHMNDISAAIGLAQLKKLDEMNSQRRRIKNLYNEGLKDIEQITLPLDDDDLYQSSWHIYSISCISRDKLSVYLQEKGISTGVHYKPIHLYKCYGNTPTLPNAETLFNYILSLPMYPTLATNEVEYIIDCIRGFYASR